METKIKRRTFIQKSALFASGFVCREAFGDNSSISYAASTATKATRSSQTETVIVVGAGISGLSAAKALHSLGHQVTVLEGRNRIGGRIWTDRSLSGTPLDLGASWIHGLTGNPLTDLTQQFNITTSSPTDYNNTILYHVDGTWVPETEEDVIYNRFLELKQAALEAHCNGSHFKISVDAALAPLIASRNFSNQELLELDYSLTAEIETNTAGGTSDLSLCLVDANGEGFEGEDVVLPGGFDQVTNQLANGLTIQLEHIVQAITYDDNGVTVITNQGELQGDRGIVTLPLGGLKKGTVTFTPELPTDKQTAIQNLGMGVMNKVFLRFPHVFWDNVEFIEYIPPVRGEWVEWVNFNPYLGEPILMAFLVGDQGKAMQALCDEETIRFAMGTLRRIYGESIPNPSGALITRWGEDPFAYGAYSYFAASANRTDRDILAQPVGDRLFFAGEATSDYSSTVHGAYLSGRREAQRIDSRVSI